MQASEIPPVTPRGLVAWDREGGIASYSQQHLSLLLGFLNSGSDSTFG